MGGPNNYTVITIRLSCYHKALSDGGKLYIRIQLLFLQAGSLPHPDHRTNDRATPRVTISSHPPPEPPLGRCNHHTHVTGAKERKRRARIHRHLGKTLHSPQTRAVGARCAQLKRVRHTNKCTEEADPCKLTTGEIRRYTFRISFSLVETLSSIALENLSVSFWIASCASLDWRIVFRRTKDLRDGRGHTRENRAR